MRNMVGSKHFSWVCWEDLELESGVWLYMRLLVSVQHPMEVKSRQLHKTVWGPGERLGLGYKVGNHHCLYSLKNFGPA